MRTLLEPKWRVTLDAVATAASAGVLLTLASLPAAADVSPDAPGQMQVMDHEPGPDGLHRENGKLVGPVSSGEPVSEVTNEDSVTRTTYANGSYWEQWPMIEVLPGETAGRPGR